MSKRIKVEVELRWKGHKLYLAGLRAVGHVYAPQELPAPYDMNNKRWIAQSLLVGHASYQPTEFAAKQAVLDAVIAALKGE